MEYFLVFLLVSFGLGFNHKVKIFWRISIVFVLAFVLAFIYIFFRKI